MIESAEEFVRLRTSVVPDDYNRAARESASTAVWLDVIERYPDMRFWVAQNKTVPLSVLEVLRHDPDDNVRFMVRNKRSWARAHPEDTNRWEPPKACDQCPHPISEHVLWPPDAVCAGWMHCGAEDCSECWHDWPARDDGAPKEV